VLGVSQTISYPYDFSSGVGTGEPSHSGITVTKPLDTASPLLAEAAAKKAKIDKITIELTRDPVGGGRTQMYYVITLEDVRVTDISLGISSETNYPHIENVTFAYRTVIWKHDPGGKETQFDFTKPGD
jgi:type VI secretion system Hcp family effector